MSPRPQEGYWHSAGTEILSADITLVNLEEDTTIVVSSKTSPRLRDPRSQHRPDCTVYCHIPGDLPA